MTEPIIKWLNKKRYDFIKWSKQENKTFNSDFTFFRGKSISQNDLVFSNTIDAVDTLDKLKKMVYSDHCFCNVYVYHQHLHSIGICACMFKRLIEPRPLRRKQMNETTHKYGTYRHHQNYS